MKFDYAGYYNECFVIPLRFMLVIIVVFVYIVAKFFVIDILIRKKLNLENALSVLCSFVVVGYLMFIHIGILANGGIYLMRERETDATSVTGTIESIELMNYYEFGRPRSEYKVDEYNGVRFVIDEAPYLGIARGELVAGDLVEVTFLPKSKYILEIRKIE